MTRTVNADGYIYGLLDPQTKEIRYIGQTVDLQRRFNEHCEVFNGTSKCQWVKGLLSDGLKPEIVVLEKTTRKRLSYCEKWWITVGKRNGWNLLNTANPTRKHVKFEDLFSSSLSELWDEYNQLDKPVIIIRIGFLALTICFLIGVLFVLSTWSVSEPIYSILSGLVVSITVFKMYLSKRGFINGVN